MAEQPLLEARSVSKRFGSVIALSDINMAVRPREVHCLLGDNGAGKSTLIKTFAGVHQPTEGELRVDGAPVQFGSPREALDTGIATVFQDLALVPLMSATRNFFMGREPVIGRGPFRRFDARTAERITAQEMWKIGIDVRDPTQPVGTMSGGERQCLAIARAVYFGAKVLILDEPTSALGVSQASMVLRYVARAKAAGLGVIFITHNVHHAFPVGDSFTLLNRGRSLGTHTKDEVSRDELMDMMAGGKEMADLEAELKAAAQQETDPKAEQAETQIAEDLHQESQKVH
ncbi:ATP-binding cassette domain-containing protein [Rhodovibrio sodomensis]|nr:ATP-binding cassette domain-containing protein [Rhodovibrio sodomensis]